MSKEQEILPIKKKSSPLKTIFVLAIVALLLFFGFKKFQHYQRQNHLGDVLVITNDSIDFNYHDKTLLTTMWTLQRNTIKLHSGCG